MCWLMLNTHNHRQFSAVICDFRNNTTMKNTLYILTCLLFLTNCKNPTQKDEAVCLSCDVEDEMQRASDDLDKFDTIVIDLYNKIETNPNKVINETQLLIQQVKTEPDPNNVRWNKLGSLYDLRAETFYKIGEFSKSIEEIYNSERNNQETLGGKFSFGSSDCIHLACNYVKLKDYKKARLYIDSAGKGWYITDFILANYYEVIGDKEQAISAYQEILAQDEHDHYSFYKDAQKRVDELSKLNPKLLNELFYPSDRTDIEICKTDNERRTKIFDLINNLPEVKNCKNCNVVSIYQEPKNTKSSKYWIKVGYDNGSNLVSQFNFFVDTLTYKITFLDTQTDKQLTLDEWRRQK